MIKKNKQNTGVFKLIENSQIYINEPVLIIDSSDIYIYIYKKETNKLLRFQVFYFHIFNFVSLYSHRELMKHKVLLQ